MSVAEATGIFGSEDFDALYGSDAKDFGEEELKPSTGRTCSEPGRYHVNVVDVKGESPDERGVFSVVKVDLEILDGENPDQKGKMIYHRIRLFRVLYNKKRDQDGKETKENDKEAGPIGHEPYSPNYIKQAIRAAYAFGLVDTPTLQGVNWMAAVGTQCIVRVDERKDDNDRKPSDRKFYEIGFGNFWRLDDEDVSDVPKDAEALAMATGGAGIGGDIDDDLDDI